LNRPKGRGIKPKEIKTTKTISKKRNECILFDNSSLMLVVGGWLLVVGCWLLVVGCWLLVVGWWLLVVGCWLFHFMHKFSFLSRGRVAYISDLFYIFLFFCQVLLFNFFNFAGKFKIQLRITFRLFTTFWRPE
jgi:hypothetical protein